MFPILLLFAGFAGADVHINFGYGLSKPVSEYYGEHFKGGITAGIRYDVPVNESALIDFGLRYIQRGGKDNAPVLHHNYRLNAGDPDSGWSIFRYDYLSATLLFKIRNWNVQKLRPAFYFGPRVDILLNYRHWIEPENVELTNYCRLGDRSLSRIILGMTTGIEIAPFFRHSVGPVIRIGGDLDLTSLTNTNLSGPLTGYTIKFAIDITAGIVIRTHRTPENRPHSLVTGTD